MLLRLSAKGEWSQAFAFDRQGRGYVVRFGAHVDDFERATGFRRTFQFARSARPAGGRSRRGIWRLLRSLGADARQLHRPDRRSADARCCSALFAALDAMRLADLSPTAGFGGLDGAATPCASWQEVLLGVADDSPGDRIGGWRAKLAASPVGSALSIRAYDRLQALSADLPDERHLIHNDLLHFNVLSRR